MRTMILLGINHQRMAPERNTTAWLSNSYCHKNELRLNQTPDSTNHNRNCGTIENIPTATCRDRQLRCGDSWRPWQHRQLIRSDIYSDSRRPWQHPELIHSDSRRPRQHPELIRSDIYCDSRRPLQHPELICSDIYSDSRRPWQHLHWIYRRSPVSTQLEQYMANVSQQFTDFNQCLVYPAVVTRSAR